MKSLTVIWILLRAQLHITKNTFGHSKLRGKISTILLILATGFLMTWLYEKSADIVRFVQSPIFTEALRKAAAQKPGLAPNIMASLLALPSLLLLFAWLMLTFSSFNSILSNLYLSGDLDLLLVAPIPMRAVFILKFFSGLFSQYIFLFFLFAPILLGFGAGMGYDGVYQVVTSFTLLLLPLLPAGLGSILVMAVVRVIPAKLAREVVSALGGLLAIGFYFLSLTPEIAPKFVGKQNIDSLLQFNKPFLPPVWAGKALIAAGQHDFFALFSYGSSFALLSLCVFVGCLVFAEHLYYIGWSNIAFQGGKSKEKPKAIANQSAFNLADSFTFFFNKHLSPFVPAQSLAILGKDWRIFPRDLRNLQQAIFPLVLAGIWTIRLIMDSPELRNELEDPKTVEIFTLLREIGSLGIAIFVCSALANAIAGPGISREQQAFWLLKTAPISSIRILLGKLMLIFLPYPLVGTPLLIVLTLLQHASFLSFMRIWGILLLLGLGTSALSLSLGAIFPRLNWGNPQRQATFQASCLSLLLSPLLSFFLLTLILAIPYAAAKLSSDLGIILALNLGGWGLALASTALVVWLSLRLGAWGLDRLEL